MPSMLSLRLSWPDVRAATWTWQTDRWVCGQSWLRPFTNPALEHALLRGDQNIMVVVVREAVTGMGLPGDADASVVTASLPTWPGDYLTVRLTPSAVTFTAGTRGTAPLYLYVNDGVLHGSWDLATFAGTTAVDRLCDRAVVRALTRRHRYSAETLHAGAYRVTERATATWTPTGLAITYPAPAPQIARPRTLRPDADPVAAFDEILTSAVGRSAVNADQTAIELSGGVDSGNVAASVADTYNPGVHSYGLIVPGPLGELQAGRRQAYVHVNRLADVTHPAAATPPFTPDGVRGRGEPHDPAGDFYAEAFDAARAHLATTGARVVFTGLGGDELTALRRSERGHTVLPPDLPHWLGPCARELVDDIDTGAAPVAPVPLPSLVAFTARNPLFLRRGLWPVSPLIDPALVQLADSLPVGWRRNKHLLRDRLRRRGLPESAVDPRHPEDFTALMNLGLRRHGLPLLAAMTRESLLVDAGYLDPDELRNLYHGCMAGGLVPSLLYDTIACEVGLRSLINQPVTVEGTPA